MNTPRTTYTDLQIAETIQADNIAHGLALTGAPKLARDRAIRVLDAQAAQQAAQQMCPMHCGNPAHVCKARGRCVYIVTDLRTRGEHI